MIRFTLYARIFIFIVTNAIGDEWSGDISKINEKELSVSMMCHCSLWSTDVGPHSIFSYFSMVL
jgi:hypothetical protein